ncbi:MAG: hypothetical protein HOL01_09435 [Planctomycetaceae bacterium]|nr:hypothetical protein [Planctomycetaceae bacterium]
MNSLLHGESVSADVSMRQKTYGTPGAVDGGSATWHQGNKDNAFGVENSRRKIQNVDVLCVRQSCPAIMNPGKHIDRKAHSEFLLQYLTDSNNGTSDG